MNTVSVLEKRRSPGKILSMKIFRFESISKNLYLLVILAILPAMAILLYTGIENRRQSIEHAQNQIMLLTHTMAEAQQDLTDSVQKMLATLSLIPQVQSADRKMCNELFRSVLNQNPNYVNVTLTDLNGEVIASGKPLTITNFGDRKHVRDVLKTKKFSIGEYIISRIGDATPAFAFAHPVFDKNNKLKAVLTAPIKLSHFSSFYDLSNLPSQSFVAITDHKGIRLFYYPPKKVTNPVGKPIKTTNWEKARNAEEPGIFISRGSDGLRRIFAFEQVRFKSDETPYIYVWTGTPEANVLEPVNATLTRNLILLLLATVFSLFISWLIGKKTVLSPIQSLVNLTREFAEGNFATRSEVITKSGELSTLTNAFHDMADRLVRNQRILLESEERFKTLFEYAPEAYFLTDTEGHFLDGNKKAEKLLEYKRERIIRDDFLEFDTFLLKKFHKIPEHLAKNRDGQPAGPDEFTLNREDGRQVLVEISTHPIRIGGQDVVLWIARDITERKQAEEALKLSHERFLTVLESIDATIYVADMETYEILFMNKKMIESFGRDLTGKVCWDVFRGESGPCSHCTNDQLVDENRNPTGVCVWQGKNPITEEWYINYDRAIEWTDGRLVRLQIATDITHLKKMEEELRQAHKMEAVGTLAGGIAHDFNNLLMGIQGRISLISFDMSSNHPIMEHINAIEDYIRNAVDLTKQLLGFVRGGKYEVKPVDINDLMLTTANMFGRTHKEISIHHKTHSKPIVVEADKSQLNQVLLNIFINAWQAMPNGGDLYLETSTLYLDEENSKPVQIEPGYFCMISVIDTGIGMDKATRQRIFDPFFTTKDKGRGTGLGLASAYGIVKNHGGTIKVMSEPGHGTTFNIYLPLSEAEAQHELTVEKNIVTGNETVLIVDDEEMILEVGKSMLEKLGYHVVVAGNGEQAVEMVANMKNQIDLVILDMIMPGMDGEKTFVQIREIQPELSILLSSGYSINGQATKIMRRGCDGFIQKPFNISGLARKIREVLDSEKDSTQQ